MVERIKKVVIHWMDGSFTTLEKMRDFLEWVKEIKKVGFENDGS